MSEVFVKGVWAWPIVRKMKVCDIKVREGCRGYAARVHFHDTRKESDRLRMKRAGKSGALHLHGEDERSVEIGDHGSRQAGAAEAV